MPREKYIIILMIGGEEYEKKKKAEESWWEQTTARKGIINRILHNPLIYSTERINYNYIFPKTQMTGVIARYYGKNAEKLLIAPCGSGDDYKYLSSYGKEIYGIDLSRVAVERCPAEMKVTAGDILQSGYQDKSFDLIASPLFFHHLLKIGFKPFLKEFYRILKPGGGLVILEPSLWYPLNVIVRPLKRLFHNPYGEVEDEAPFRPGLMLEALKSAGFVNVKAFGATFSHPTFPVPLARFVNRLSEPLLTVSPVKYWAWMVIYWAEKK